MIDLSVNTEKLHLEDLAPKKRIRINKVKSTKEVCKICEFEYEGFATGSLCNLKYFKCPSCKGNYTR